MIYDILILGGGPAGYLAAERAGKAGLNTALVEMRSLGGVCLNEGCIPTKTLLYSAKLYDGVAHGEKYGVTAENLSIDHAAVVRRKDKVVKSLVAGVKAQMRASKVTVFSERGVIRGRTEEGFVVEAGKDTIIGKKLLIATGSSPAIPPIPGVREGLESGFVLTNREILDLTEKPETLCIIGGGVIGLEFASYFTSIGAKVTVVEMLDHIAGDTDQDLVQVLMADYAKRGVTFELNARVTAVDADGVRFQREGKETVVKADKVLLSIGRRANTADIGLEALGVYTERGAVVTDSRMRTNIPDVYAAGDVNGKLMLAHKAYREAEVAVNNMLGQHDIMRYDAIPSVLYTNPEIASVGETEASATAKGYPFKTVRLPMQYSGRYQAENEGGRGIMKLLVHQHTNRVLGMHVIGNYASEFIIAAASYMELGVTLEEIKKIVFPHPTVSEIIREAVFQYEQ
ncbi:MAG: dihydrolipoyl dehydrogenase [Clostridiales bacterium]|nr:dihydrolipoyl dehydrogenase [Clostridiales bacterium]